MFEQFAFLNLSTTDLILIFLVVLLLFGGKKLPELARSAGHSVRELRKGLDGVDEKQQKQTDDKTRSESAS